MGELTSDIQFLPGVGPKRAALIKRELDLHTLDDLIHFYPFRYIDRSTITPIVSATPDLAYVQVQGTVVSRNLVNIKHLSVIVDDGTARMEMVFFKGVKWNFDRLVPGATFRRWTLRSRTLMPAAPSPGYIPPPRNSRRAALPAS